MGVGIDKITKLFGLKAATAVADAVDSCLQTALLPRCVDVVVSQKYRIPELKIHWKPVRLDVQEKRGGEIFVQLQGLKPLALIHVGRWHLPPFT